MILGDMGCVPGKTIAFWLLFGIHDFLYSANLRLMNGVHQVATLFLTVWSYRP